MTDGSRPRRGADAEVEPEFAPPPQLELLDELPGMLSIVASSKRFVWANQAFLRATRESLDTLQDKQCHEVWGRDRLSDGCPVCRAIAERRPVECDVEADPDEHGARTFRLVATPLRGEIGGVALTAWDISAERRAEGQLAASAERFERALANIPDVVTMYDADLIIRFVNDACLRVSGLSRDHYIGKRDQEALPPFVWEPYYPTLVRARDTGVLQVIELDLAMPDGDVRNLRISCVPVLGDDGEVREVLGITHDFTERKRAELQSESLQQQLAQAQKLESIGRLAGGVAHDFNNLLNVISGYTELLQDNDELAPSLRQDVVEIRRAAEKATNLTRQLLGFARRQTVTPVALDINATIEGMLGILRRLLGETIALEWFPREEAWLVVLDPTQVDQVLTNLCINARDAMQGTGRVTIETANVVLDDAHCASRPDFVPGAYVQLAVSDNGPGMDRETLGRIFEPFFTTKRLGQGTGLGLATVYGIVKQNGGFVSVYSEPGKGSTFKLYLPRHVGEAADRGREPEDRSFAGGYETVLLVEDDHALLALSARMLEALGYRVLAATTTDEAIRIAEDLEVKIHLLMTDVVMPVMNGKMLSDRVTRVRPTLRTLYMSGYTANIIAHHGVVEQGINFIQKPFTMGDLARKLRESLR